MHSSIEYRTSYIECWTQCESCNINGLSCTYLRCIYREISFVYKLFNSIVCRYPICRWFAQKFLPTYRLPTSVVHKWKIKTQRLICTYNTIKRINPVSRD